MSIQAVIEEKLLAAFSPIYLDVINESHQHNVAPGSESHFKVVMATSAFEGERLLKRHRAINSVLATELSDHIHALALHTYSEKEWQDMHEGDVPLSPKCMGGSKK